MWHRKKCYKINVSTYKNFLQKTIHMDTKQTSIGENLAQQKYEGHWHIKDTTTHYSGTTEQKQ